MSYFRVILSVFFLLVSADVWALNGDMGLGTEPLTDGSADYPWLIEDMADFEVFRGQDLYIYVPGGDDIEADLWYSNMHTRLMVDLNLSGPTYNSAVIGFVSGSYVQYRGVFDGNGHTISSFRIESDEDRLGLFAYIGQYAQVKNLNVESPMIFASTGFGEGYYVGALCGANQGVLVGCSSSGYISGNYYSGGLCGYNSGTIINCSSSAYTLGPRRYIGGLVGYCYAGRIVNSYATGRVNGFTGGDDVGGLCGAVSFYSTVERCYATGDVDGDERVGGFCGENDGTIRNCYATGDAEGEEQVGGFAGLMASKSIGNSYAAGSAAGTSYVHGFCGRHYGGTFTECFWDTTVGGTYANLTGVLGRDTTQMMQYANYDSAGWDLTGEDANGTADIWRMCASGADYPRLGFSYLMEGDFACPDGCDEFDLMKLGSEWLMTYSSESVGADANWDKKVNNKDYQILAGQWQSGL